MSKKHYVATAKMLSELRKVRCQYDPDRELLDSEDLSVAMREDIGYMTALNDMEVLLTAFFKDDNPRFQPEKFRNAASVKPRYGEAK